MAAVARREFLKQGAAVTLTIGGAAYFSGMMENQPLLAHPILRPPGALTEEVIIGPQARAQARTIGLDCQIEPNLPMIICDKRRIGQVLNNLLENAIRHTMKGGKVTVKVSRTAGGVQFAVQDTGEGIASDEVDKIFLSFYQAANQKEQGRLGLGLSIAREIVENHGGKLWVESPGLGKGATFLFTIPLANTSEK